MNNGFYIYLPSNASMDVYPDNVCSHYRIRLDNPISLTEKPFWEVALVEMSYVHCFNTIEKGESIEVVENYETLVTAVALTSEDLNRKPSSYFYQNDLGMDVKGEKVHIYIHKPKSTLYMPKVIARHLGFLPPPESNKILEEPIEPTAPRPWHEMPVPEGTEDPTAAKHQLYAEKRAAYDEAIRMYSLKHAAYGDHQRRSLKLEEKRGDYKDENMHTITNKTDKSWTAIAPYLRSQFPVQSYKTTFEIQLRTIPEVVNTIKPRDGHYPTAEGLLQEMTRASDHVKQHVKWEFLPSKNRFQVDLKNYAMRFHDALADVLGFQKSTLKGDLVYEAPNKPDLLRGIYHMYVYTDLCEYTRVGNVEVPLLRAIPLQDVSYGKVKSYTFTNPIYVPLSKRQIDTIEVEMRDDAGALMPLDEGKTVLVLHIRPRQL